MSDHQPLAYHSLEFLESDEARPLRILAEYLEPLRRFQIQNIQDTVVFFGSARIDSKIDAERALARLSLERPDRSRGRKRASISDSRRRALADRLKRSRKAVAWSRYYEDARRLAHMLTEWSLTLDAPRHRFVVCSGGGPGIMEAANRGAHEAGGKTIGLNIRLPFEQGPNRYITPGLLFEFHYFFMRKFWFAYLAKALVIFPGGFGTLDEMFEFLTLAQTQKLSKKLDVILYGSEYWDRIVNLEPMAEWGAIAEQDLKLLHRFDSPDAAFEHLRGHLAQHVVPDTPQEDRAPGIAKTRG
jgi:uncharacterized protein (TIGR00730 family)